MDELLKTLSSAELERVMGVLSRDHRLREREQNRVTKLGIELVREKRQGALVVNDKRRSSRSEIDCARCRSALPAVARLNKAKWRCCICRHLVCKECRVVKEFKTEKDLEQLALLNNNTRKNADLMTSTHEQTNVVSDNHDADVSSSDSENNIALSEDAKKQEIHKECSTIEDISFQSLSGNQNCVTNSSNSSYSMSDSEKMSQHHFDKLPKEGANFNQNNPHSTSQKDTNDFSIDQFLKDDVSIFNKDVENDLELHVSSDSPDKKTHPKASNSDEVYLKPLPEKEVNASRARSSSTDESRALVLKQVLPERFQDPTALDEKQKQIMKTFLSMAQAKGTATNPLPVDSIHEGASVVSASKKSLEDRIFTSVPIKALTMLSQTPLELASKLFQSSSSGNIKTTFSSIIKSSLLHASLSEKRCRSTSESDPIVGPRITARSDEDKTFNEDLVNRECSKELEQRMQRHKQKGLQHDAPIVEGAAPFARSELKERNKGRRRDDRMQNELLAFSRKFGLVVYEFDGDEAKVESCSSEELMNGTSDVSADAEGDSSKNFKMQQSYGFSLKCLNACDKNATKRVKKSKAIQIRRQSRKLRRKKILQKRANRRIEDESLLRDGSPNRIQSNDSVPDDQLKHESVPDDQLKYDRIKKTKSTMNRGLNMMLNTVGEITKNFLEPQYKETTYWVCKVCHKTMDLQKKTGSWFHKAGKAEAMWSESYYKSPESSYGSRSSIVSDEVAMLDLEAMPESEEAFKDRNATGSYAPASTAPKPPLFRRNSADVTSFSSMTSPSPKMRLSRNRSQTLQPQPVARRDFVGIRYLSNRKVSRKTTSETIHASLKKYVAEPHQEDSTLITKTTFIVGGESNVVAASIIEGPKEISVMKGFPISLCCVLKGTPPLDVMWRKGKNQIQHSNACNIENTNHTSALTILRSEPGDSGCYTLQVNNMAGSDCFPIQVQVVDPPDPPSAPQVENITGIGLLVTWQCDIRRNLSSQYFIEMMEVDEAEGNTKEWTRLPPVRSTSHTVKNLKNLGMYKFRVSAQNDLGFSSTSPTSDPVRYLAVSSTSPNSDPVRHLAVNNSEEDSTIGREQMKEMIVSKRKGALPQTGSDSMGDNVTNNNTITKNFLSSYYDMKEKIWTGRYGDTYRMTHRRTGEEFAVKRFPLQDDEKNRSVFSLIGVIKELRHEKVVRFIDVYRDEGEVAMVMELLRGFILLELIAGVGFNLTETKCARFAKQICEGLRYIHSHSIAHLNLEPRNIMAANGTETLIKIVGFGSARKLPGTEPSEHRSVEFAAPEMIEGREISLRSDMWSLGVFCYIMISGISPFWGGSDQGTKSKVKSYDWQFDDEAFHDVSKAAKNFISELLVRSHHRLTSDEAVRHDWLMKRANEGIETKMKTKRLKEFTNRYKNKFSHQSTTGTLKRLSSLMRAKSIPQKLGGDARILHVFRETFNRGKETEVVSQRQRPTLAKLFDDIEIIEGAIAQFKCVVIGKPDPEIKWYKDGVLIQPSAHYQFSYLSDDVCSLSIQEVTQSDEAEYSLRATNALGQVTHCAELTVISAD